MYIMNPQLNVDATALFIASVYATRVLMNLVEGRGVGNNNLIMLGAGVLGGMFVKDKRVLIAGAVGMVVVMKLSLVVREGMAASKLEEDEL
jgi:hypothetical protein